MAPVIPCYASENSLLRSRREFGSKPLLQRRLFGRLRRRSAPILQNSLLFSLLAGNFRPETGSLETASSASQSPWLGLLAVGSENPRHSAPLLPETEPETVAAGGFGTAKYETSPSPNWRVRTGFFARILQPNT